ncbi:MAG: hydrogen gas-evolving membrane-bound hydrogenase subunit E [Candidatus Cloacimonadaceae bacterium]
MIKYMLIFLVLIGMAWMFAPLLTEFFTPTRSNDLAAAYVYGTAADLNMPNAVTAVVVTYRGLDTLGEVTVLFLATAGVGFFLRRKEQGKAVRRPGSEVLKSGANLLSPLIIMFGIYIFSHGHLTPGGGFPGGVVMASAFLLLLLANENFGFSHGVINLTETISGLGFVLIGLAGLLLLGLNHFLDPRWLGLGQFGRLFSAGAIPLIYSFIGLKVGAEMSGLLDSLQSDGGEA